MRPVLVDGQSCLGLAASPHAQPGLSGTATSTLFPLTASFVAEHWWRGEAARALHGAGTSVECLDYLAGGQARIHAIAHAI